jgi:hypothetical protein
MSARVIYLKTRRSVEPCRGRDRAMDTLDTTVLDMVVGGIIGDSAIPVVHRIATLWRRRGEDTQRDVLAALEAIEQRTKRRS